MPVRALTDVERRRLSGFPQEIPEDELFFYFSLSGADRAMVPERTSPAVRLGFAVSLCSVRYLGFCPDDLHPLRLNYWAPELGFMARAAN